MLPRKSYGDYQRTRQNNSAQLNEHFRGSKVPFDRSTRLKCKATDPNGYPITLCGAVAVMDDLCVICACGAAKQLRGVVRCVQEGSERRSASGATTAGKRVPHGRSLFLFSCVRGSGSMPPSGGSKRYKDEGKQLYVADKHRGRPCEAGARRGGGGLTERLNRAFSGTSRPHCSRFAGGDAAATEQGPI